MPPPSQLVICFLLSKQQALGKTEDLCTPSFPPFLLVWDTVVKDKYWKINIVLTRLQMGTQVESPTSHRKKKKNKERGQRTGSFLIKHAWRLKAR